MEQSFLSILERFGFPVFMVIVLLYVLVLVVRRMQAKLDSQDEFIRNTLIQVVEKNTAAFERMNQTMAGCAANNDRALSHDKA